MTRLWNENESNKRLVIMIMCFQVCMWSLIVGIALR